MVLRPAECPSHWHLFVASTNFVTLFNVLSLSIYIGSIEALVAYIHRAETPVNISLGDPEFAQHLQSAGAVQKFRVAQAAAARSDEAVERVS